MIFQISIPKNKPVFGDFHFNVEGKVALYGVESREYQQFIDDGEIKHREAFSLKN